MAQLKCGILVVISLAFWLAAPAPAKAQSADKGLSNWTAAAAPAPPAMPLGTVAPTGSGVQYDGWFTPTQTRPAFPAAPQPPYPPQPNATGAVVLQLYGSASNSAIAGVTDTFGPSVVGTQTFTLNEAANVSLNSFLNGTFVYANGSTNGTASVSELVTLTQTAGTFPAGVAAFPYTFPQTVMYSQNGNFAAPAAPGAVTVTVPDIFEHLTIPSVPAGTFTVKATFALTGGVTNGAGSADAKNTTTLTADFFTPGATGRNGLSVNFSAAPAAPIAGNAAAPLGDSRAAVNVSDAVRGQFGVTGAGVQVGVLELGQPIAANLVAVPSLAGRLTAAANNGAVTGNYFSEHTLAVAGIIAANDPNNALGTLAHNANSGVAPGASIVYAAENSYNVAAPNADQFQAAASALFGGFFDNGIHVINESAGIISGMDPNGDIPFLNSQINTKPVVTFVQAAGNNGNTTIATPGQAANIITVGALNRTFSTLASFSSFGTGAGGAPLKPDIVAPGEYINAPQSRTDAQGGGNPAFGNTFLGNDFDSAVGGVTDDISGTSFAAPFVSGAAALLDNYSINANGAGMGAGHTQDHRVIKAVLLNSATTTQITRIGGAAWSQGTNFPAGVTPTPTAANPLVVTTSLDPQLGAGLLNVGAALTQFQPGGITQNTSNGNTIMTANAAGYPVWWALAQVVDDGHYDFLLGNLGSTHVRATLTWDAIGGNTASPLNLSFYQEGSNPGNLPGFDPANPNADTLLASTNLTMATAGPNVDLLDFNLSASGTYYLDVTDLDPNNNVVFGIFVAVPAPGSLSLVGVVVTSVVGWAARRRRRSRTVYSAACTL